MPRDFPLSVVALSVVSACGPAAPPAAEPRLDAPSHASSSTEAAPVEAGSYRLRLSVPCGESERTVTGTLSLKRLSGADAPSDGRPRQGALLWGQADIDFEGLRACLSGPALGSQEPIHPSVLVEVLHWEGEPRRQVLLASTERKRGASAAGGGIALWVASVAERHITGVWSRWELTRAVEGEFDAVWLSAESAPSRPLGD